MISSYPSVYSLGHKAARDLFAEEVLIEEKIDGSQFSFGRLNGEIICRSKGVSVYTENPGMFDKAVETVERLAARLPEGYVYRTEYLRAPKHNILAYARIPTNHLIVFDIDRGGEDYVPYPEKCTMANALGLETVNRLVYGIIGNLEELHSLLERESGLGGTRIEGMVIKNYARYGVDKKVLMAKWVREEFKERLNKEWKATNKPDVLALIVQALRTEARRAKAVQHLREAGEIEDSPRDIGKLIREVQKDVVQEEMEWIKDKLYERHIKDILRGTSAGVAEWYKEQLAKKQFEEKS